MGRQPCCDKVGLKRGPWTIEEDRKLITFILNNGIHCWRTVPKLAGLLRCGKSCRLRWINYLRPDLKRGKFSEAEEEQIIQLHSRLGNRWSKIASYFPGRTDNEIKNHWNTRIKKRLKVLELDPVTHKPIPQENKELEPNSSRVQEEKFEEKVTNENEEKSEVLLSNYEMICKSLDVELWMNQEVSASNSHSSTFSLDYCSNFLMGESSIAQQEDSIKQWVDGVDSMLSWETFNNQDQGLFFFEN